MFLFLQVLSRLSRLSSVQVQGQYLRIIPWADTNTTFVLEDTCHAAGFRFDPTDCVQKLPAWSVGSLQCKEDDCHFVYTTPEPG